MAVVSRVVVERVVKCPFGVAHDYAQEYLEGAEREITVRVPLRDFFRSLPGQSHKPVKLVWALHPDETETGRGHDAMLVEWHAGTRLFPNFHGTLRLRIDTVDTTRLTFEGAYRAPMGRLGRVFDAVLGKAIARATMLQLLHRIGDALERREAEFTASQGRRAS
ncbi:MAG TPA: hypothetical protein VHT05_10905 [Candidatus Elarobacter sp.]|nr:hypothetical protein [Candidatus Elarobacter sp.]